MPGQHPAVQAMANERFKQEFGTWFWACLILATLLHAGIFVSSPTFGIQSLAIRTTELTILEIPEDIEIPPAPAPIQRPATPVVARTTIDETITLAPTTIEDNPVANLPPPPARTADIATAPTFTPMTVRPQLLNTREVQQALERQYPPMLRDAGITGSVVLWFFIGEDGDVRTTVIHQGSGYDAFDQAAQGIARIMRFSPAYNRDQRVPVWVSLPITFEVQ
jgi:periplasmic protein TonB